MGVLCVSHLGSLTVTGVIANKLRRRIVLVIMVVAVSRAVSLHASQVIYPVLNRQELIFHPYLLTVV